MSHINILPDLVLRSIFANFGISDQLTMRQVCHSWRFYQKMLSFEKDTLALNFGSRPFAVYFTNNVGFQEDNHLNDELTKLACDELSRDQVNELFEAFPQIRELTISVSGINCTNSFIDNLIFLLQKWSSTLTKVRMLCDFRSSKPYDASAEVHLFICENLRRLLDCLGTLPHLESLIFETSNQIYPKSGQIDYQLPEFGQLRQFCFRSSSLEGSRGPIIKWLRSHGAEDDRLKNIAIFPFYIHFITDNHPVMKKITELTESFIFPQHQPRYAPYTNLLNINLDFFFGNDSDFLELINSLSEMKQLQSVWLELDLNGHSLSDYDYKPRSSIAQLSSVKNLTIQLEGIDKHSSFLFRHWDWAFPNLEKYFFYHYCNNPRGRFNYCNHFTDQNTPDDVILESVREILRTLANCSKLREICVNLDKFYSQGSERKWTIADLIM